VIRVPISRSYIKRTIRVNYGWTQATPKSGYLDPGWTRAVPIWPGMCFMRTTGASGYTSPYQTFGATSGGPNYTLLNATGVPAGFVGNYIGGEGIDELLDTGVSALAIWVLDPDAEFEILAPAFDASLTWTDPGNGTEALVYARTANLGSPVGLNGLGGAIASGSYTGTYGLQGQLVTVADANRSTWPVARLLSVNSNLSITIGGLAVRSQTSP
jgi:hypothetical protein